MNKYQEASMAGKWVWVGREFLTDHGPMTPSEYLQQVSRLMPGHLRGPDGKLIPRMALAKKSLQFGFGRGYFILCGAMIEATERSKPPSELRQMILALAKRPEGVIASDVDYPNRRTVLTYFSRMSHRGELERVEKGRYKLAEKVGNRGK